MLAPMKPSTPRPRPLPAPTSPARSERQTFLSTIRASQTAVFLEGRAEDVDGVLEESGGGAAGVGAAAGHTHGAHGIGEEGDALFRAADVSERMGGVDERRPDVDRPSAAETSRSGGGQELDRA